MTLAKGNQSNQGKTCPTGTLCTIYLEWAPAFTVWNYWWRNWHKISWV